MFTQRKKKVGLALSGGSARGLAHIGVLEVLEKAGIPIHYIAGTSAGALVGALYAREVNAGLIKQQALALDWKRLATLVDLALPVSGFISGRRLAGLLGNLMGGDVRFEELKIPLACVAADIMTGEEIVIKEGSVLEAVRASISIPVIFRAVRWRGRFLVDGELVNPLPVNVVKAMGADFVIAVDVIPELTNTGRANLPTKAQKEPGIFTVITHSIYMRSHVLADVRAAGADVLIKPDLKDISPGDLLRFEEVIWQGELAGQDAIGEIKRKLKG